MVISLLRPGKKSFGPSEGKVWLIASRIQDTVSLRILENGKYEFDTLIQGMSSKF